MNFTKITNERMGETYYRLKHSSGLTIVVWPKEDYNTTHALIATPFGSNHAHFVLDGKTITVPDGTAHFLEHKLFESEEGDAFSLYAKTGASANAFTSYEMTCYLFSCTDRFKESLEILFDLVQSPYFTEETIAKEQGIIAQEIKMYDDNPEWRVFMNLLQALYENHPIHTDVAGSVESIAKITPEVLYHCYHGFYNLNDMVLFIGGKADPEEVLAIADSKLKHSPPAYAKTIFPEEPYKVKEPYVEQHLPVAVPLFSLGFKEDAPFEIPTAKENICTNILLRAFSDCGSSLYRELLDKELINSSFSADYFAGNGYRSVIFEGESKDPVRTAELIKEAIVRLHETGISQEDFEIARRSFYGDMVTVLDSPSSLALSVFGAEFHQRDVFNSFDIFSSVTLSDVNERLKHQLDPKNCSLSVVTGLE